MEGGAGARENMGWEGYGRREKKDKKGREAEGKLKKESVCCFFTAYDPLKNIKPLAFLTSI